MSFSIGIIGLPNAGKSTLFKALTKKEVEIAPYAFSTRDPNVGIIQVPDKRLEKLAQIIKPQKAVPTFIEFVDIAGLIKNAHKGEGLGNQFLSHIRQCDALLQITRAFHNPEIEHSEGTLNPKRDVDIIKTELLMKDLETAKNAIAKLEKQVGSQNREFEAKHRLLKKINEQLAQGKCILELNLSEGEKGEIKEFQFLTAKPMVFVSNIGEAQPSPLEEGGIKEGKAVSFDLKLEQEISELSTAEAEELQVTSGLDKLISTCYNALNLITFFTITGGKETRAWTLKKKSDVLQAASCVHSDFEENFIKADVINWQKLIEAGSWSQARQLGQIQTTGKDYLVQDGDVIEFKI